MAVVCQNGRTGAIDASGHVIVPIVYDQLWNFLLDTTLAARDGKWGVADRTGMEVIPCRYQATESRIHDLARRTGGAEPEHGPNAAKYFFDRFQRLWDKYRLTPEECEQVREAVSQHSTREQLRPSDKGYAVMAVLKDADALDRCRLHRGGLNPDWLRFRQSR